jgi:hypothetical protein
LAVDSLHQLIKSGFTVALSGSDGRSLLAWLTASAQVQCQQRRSGSAANPHQFEFQSKDTHSSCVIVNGWLGMLKDPNDHDCRSRDRRYKSKNDIQQMFGYESKNDLQQMGHRNVVPFVFHVSFLPIQ